MFTYRLYCLFLLAVGCLSALTGQDLRYTEVTDEAGIAVAHRMKAEPPSPAGAVCGGVAVADVNGDGRPDIYALTGWPATGALLLATADGGFEPAADSGDLDTLTHLGAAPCFFYFNDDPHVDLIIGAADGTPPRLLVNDGRGRFRLRRIDALDALAGRNTSGITAVDFDEDGRDDLFMSHWREPFQHDHFFRNRGGTDLVPADEALGFFPLITLNDYGFTANFVDADGDGDRDLLWAGDFSHTQQWENRGAAGFFPVVNFIFPDENGMGGAVGDYDRDGDTDWFVTAIYDGDGVIEGNWGGGGNQLYANDGRGNMSRAPGGEALADAGWGWATSFGDLNNDGWPDLVAVNGYVRQPQFRADSLRTWLGDTRGGFLPVRPIVNTEQGRGLVLFDYDRDGDLDLLVGQYDARLRLYRNDTETSNHYLRLALLDRNGCPAQASVRVYSDGLTLTATVRGTANYASHNEPIAHLGLGGRTRIDSVRVDWRSGPVTYYGLATDALHTLKELTPTREAGISGAWPNPVRAGEVLSVVSAAAAGLLDVYSATGVHLGRLRPISRRDAVVRYRLPFSLQQYAGTVVYLHPPKNQLAVAGLSYPILLLSP